MAATTDGILENRQEISREEVQAAIAKAVELRALHAALMQGGNFSTLRLPPPATHHAPQFSGHDYPVFTPSYEEDAAWPPCYQQLQLENSSTVSDCWNDYVIGKKTVNGDDQIINSYDHNSVANSTVIISPSHSHNHNHSHSHSQDFCKHTNRRNSCNKCNPAAIVTIETDSSGKKVKSSKSVVPLIESHSSVQTHQKNRGINFSWLRLKKKKNKNEETTSPNRMTAESEGVSQISKDMDMGIVSSIEMLKKELLEAQESRAAALKEVSGMKSSLGELKLKLENLETYCEELKQSLRQAIQSSNESNNKLDSLPQSLPGMPVTDEVMVEGFLQIVSETRSSVKQFCKTLITQIDETDENLSESLNSLLKPYKLSLDSKYSKAVLYHLVAIINQALFQDFENSVFQKNGCPKFLDPNEDQQSQFASFVGLRNLSWNEVLRKGTKFYSEEFSRFCDQKMSAIISGLSWTRPWPEQMLQAFFVAGKCVWLLHLLAFSFSPPVGILRVEENRGFDPHYMEDLFMEKRRSNGNYRVKAMAMPGFYVQDKVLKCKVICRYNKSLT